MRLATFNVQHGRSAAGRVDVGLLARSVAALGADVVGLQEVDVGARRSRGADLAAEAAAASGLRATFGHSLTFPDGGRYGNALLVRGEVGDLEVLVLPGRDAAEPRTALVAETRLRQGPAVVVAVCHLGLDGEAEEQLPAVLAALTSHPPPLVLLGDLNLGPEVVGPAVAEAGLTLVTRGGPTFPARHPRLRLDHVAVAGLDASAVVTPPLPVSDHRPLVVEVAPV